jgi:hypothetical protein
VLTNQFDEYTAGDEWREGVLDELTPGAGSAWPTKPLITRGNGESARSVVVFGLAPVVAVHTGADGGDHGDEPVLNGGDVQTANELNPGGWFVDYQHSA